MNNAIAALVSDAEVCEAFVVCGCVTALLPLLDDEHDPVAFYPLVDPPLLMETVHRVLGRPTFATAPGGRVCPVADTANAPHEGQGYISWHR